MGEGKGVLARGLGVHRLVALVVVIPKGGSAKAHEKRMKGRRF